MEDLMGLMTATNGDEGTFTMTSLMLLSPDAESVTITTTLYIEFTLRINGCKSNLILSLEIDLNLGCNMGLSKLDEISKTCHSTFKAAPDNVRGEANAANEHWVMEAMMLSDSGDDLVITLSDAPTISTNGAISLASVTFTLTNADPHFAKILHSMKRIS
jgi:hypothetical protein